MKREKIIQNDKIFYIEKYNWSSKYFVYFSNHSLAFKTHKEALQYIETK